MIKQFWARVSWIWVSWTLVILISAVTLMVTVSCSDMDAATSAVSDQADAKPYLEIEEIVTPAGLRVWYVQDQTIPAFMLRFSVRAGLAAEPQGQDGVGRLLSVLLDEGAGSRDAEIFQNEMDQYGIKIGFNAGRDYFSGSLMTTTRYQDEGIELFSDALNAPHLSDDAVSRMKHALLSELRFNQMNPQWVASRALFDTLFEGQNYARPVGGTEDTLSALTRDDVVRHHARIFCKDHLKIAVSGDIDKAQLSADIDKIFGAWPVCEQGQGDDEAVFKNNGKIVTIDRQGAQSVVLMAQRGLKRQDKDWWAVRVLDFALGGGQFSSRLMDEVRVKRGLTYGVSSAVLSYEDAPLWMVQSGVSPENADKAITLIKQIWQDVAQNGLTDQEIKAAQDYLIGSLPLALTSTGQIASILLQLQEDDLPKNTLDMRQQEIMAITPDDIRRVAAEYLRADQMVTIIVGPPPPAVIGAAPVAVEKGQE